MESSNQPESPQSGSYKQINSISNCFQSEEAMKTYYLQMTHFMSPNYCPEKGSEYARLQSLYRKLKQFINVLQLLSMHEWGKGILEIQNAEGIYMLQSNIDRKILLQTHQEIGLHLQFITQLAGNMSFVKQLLGILQCHYHNVEYLIKNMESSKNL